MQKAMNGKDGGKISWKNDRGPDKGFNIYPSEDREQLKDSDQRNCLISFSF